MRSAQASRSRSSTGRRRLPRGERLQVLLDAAEALVVEKGVLALTMEGIAARVGVNKALPYQHFTNRDAVLVALYERHARAFDARLAKAMAAAKTFAQRIDALLDTWLDELDARGALVEALDHARTADGALERLRRARLRQGFDYTAQLIRSEYALARVDASIAAGVLLAGSQGLLAVWRETGISRRKLAQTFVRFAEGAVAGLARAPRAKPLDL